MGIESVHPSGGGCINDCFVLKTSEGKFFLKRNDAKRYPKMFEAEATGLKLLSNVVNEIAPKVITYGEHDGDQLLILENIEKGSTQKEFWNDFAKKLSTLHQHTAARRSRRRRCADV